MRDDSRDHTSLRRPGEKWLAWREVSLMAERDLQKDLDTVKEDLAKLRSDIAELTQSLVDTGRSEVSAARSRLRAEARNLQRELRETLSETGAQGLKTVESVEQMLTERPLVSLLAAFGLGLLVGTFLQRR
jgi:ElaB/YqjD/DUF883 family membrane-anchored ribosome-binding protein